MKDKDNKNENGKAGIKTRDESHYAYSPEIARIMAQRPSWIVRNGNTLLLIILAIVALTILIIIRIN